MASEIASKLAHKLQLLEVIVKVILSQSDASHLKGEHKTEIREIRQLIASLLHSFDKMKNEYKKFSKHQQIYSQKMMALQHALQDAYIVSSDNTINIPLWDSLTNGELLYTMLKSLNGHQTICSLLK
jgi:CTP:phosphocholine cytidylyltransferase-like protein